MIKTILDPKIMSDKYLKLELWYFYCQEKKDLDNFVVVILDGATVLSNSQKKLKDSKLTEENAYAGTMCELIENITKDYIINFIDKNYETDKESPSETEIN